MMLRGAFGRNLKLRHYPAAINGGSLEEAKLTLTRKDGVTAVVNYTLKAIDETFEIVIDHTEWQSQANRPSVGSYDWLPLTVLNKSKYYIGGYTFKDYQYLTNNIGYEGRAVLTQEATNTGWPYMQARSLSIKHVALAEGSTALISITICDDNGTSVVRTDPSFQYVIIPKK